MSTPEVGLPTIEAEETSTPTPVGTRSESRFEQEVGVDGSTVSAGTRSSSTTLDTSSISVDPRVLIDGHATRSAPTTARPNTGTSLVWKHRDPPRHRGGLPTTYDPTALQLTRTLTPRQAGWGDTTPVQSEVRGGQRSSPPTAPTKHGMIARLCLIGFLLTAPTVVTGENGLVHPNGVPKALFEPVTPVSNAMDESGATPWDAVPTTDCANETERLSSLSARSNSTSVPLKATTWLNGSAFDFLIDSCSDLDLLGPKGLAVIIESGISFTTVREPGPPYIGAGGVVKRPQIRYDFLLDIAGEKLRMQCWFAELLPTACILGHGSILRHSNARYILEMTGHDQDGVPVGEWRWRKGGPVMTVRAGEPSWSNSDLSVFSAISIEPGDTVVELKSDVPDGTYMVDKHTVNIGIYWPDAAVTVKNGSFFTSVRNVSDGVFTVPEGPTGIQIHRTQPVDTPQYVSAMLVTETSSELLTTVDVELFTSELDEDLPRADDEIPNSTADGYDADDSEREKHFQRILRECDCTENERTEWGSIIRNQDIGRVWTTDGVGLMPGDPHRVDTGSAKPQFARQQPMDSERRLACHREITRLKDQGVLVPSTSPWNSRCLMVKKGLNEDGTIKWRFVCDFREVNRHLLYTCVAMPTVDEVLRKLGGSTYFTILDLKNAYWSVPVDDSDGDLRAPLPQDRLSSQQKLAITNPHDSERLQWARLPQGLGDSSSAFSIRLKNSLANSLSTCASAYLDDVVIYSATMRDHMRDVTAALAEARTNDIRFSLGKVQLARTAVELLGARISEGQIRIGTSHIEAFKSMPAPTSRAQLESFVGCCSYLRGQIPGLSERDAPLRAVLNQPRFSWGDAQQTAFEDLRQAVMSDPVLAIPDEDLPFVVLTDASGVGVGACLAQVCSRTGRLLPCEYFSRKLTDRQTRYSTTDRECLAIYLAMERWKYRFSRQQVQIGIYTDHRPLSWLYKAAGSSTRLFNWSSALSAFNYKIHYLSGSRNAIADSLSRLVAEGSDRSTEFSQALRASSASDSTVVTKSFPVFDQSASPVQGSNPNRYDAEVTLTDSPQTHVWLPSEEPDRPMTVCYQYDTASNINVEIPLDHPLVQHALTPFRDPSTGSVTTSAGQRASVAEKASLAMALSEALDDSADRVAGPKVAAAIRSGLRLPSPGLVTTVTALMVTDLLAGAATTGPAPGCPPSVCCVVQPIPADAITPVTPSKGDSLEFRWKMDYGPDQWFPGTLTTVPRRYGKLGSATSNVISARVRWHDGSSPTYEKVDLDGASVSWRVPLGANVGQVAPSVENVSCSQTGAGDRAAQTEAVSTESASSTTSWTGATSLDWNWSMNDEGTTTFVKTIAGVPIEWSLNTGRYASTVGLIESGPSPEADLFVVHQRVDSLLAPICQFIMDGIVPPDLDRRKALSFINRAKDYELDLDGRLFRSHKSKRGRTTLRLCVPEGMKQPLALLGHTTQKHAGSRAVYHAMKERYFWTAMEQDIILAVNSCLGCSRKLSRQTPFPLGHFPSAAQFGSRLSLDIAHLGLSKTGYSYVLVAVDGYSRSVWLTPLRGETAAEVTNAILSTIEGRLHTVPKEIVTDNGACFTAEVTTAVMSALHSHHRTSAPYAAWGNGVSEAAVRRCKRALKVLFHDNPSMWPDLLPTAEFTMNSSYHSGIGCSPFERVHGTPPRLPLDSLLDAHSSGAPTFLTAREVRSRAQACERAVANAEADLRHRVDVRNARALRTGKIQPYKVGDRVLLHEVWSKKRTGLTRGMWSPWSSDIFEITKIVDGSSSATIRSTSSSHSHERKAHVGRLWPVPLEGFVDSQTAWQELQSYDGSPSQWQDREVYMGEP